MITAPVRLAVPARPGLRERQRQETHLLIRRAAVELTLERGVANVSVKHICDAAGVSARTFFNHFHSKDEALLPDFPDFSAAAREAFVQGSEPDLVRALEELLLGHVGFLQEEIEHPVGPRMMRQLLDANPDLLPRLLAVFEAQQRLIADLVARRTGLRSDDLFCVVASAAAGATLRAAFGSVAAQDRAGAHPHPADRPAPPVRPGQLEAAIREAFSALRRLTAPDLAGSAHSSS